MLVTILLVLQANELEGAEPKTRDQIPQHELFRAARHTYRRLPTFALNEVPRDSAENCRAFCDKVYGQLLQNSLYFQACVGICASKTCGGIHSYTHTIH